jgi:pilus assembly protein CpaB
LLMLLVALLAGAAAVLFATRWMQSQSKGGRIAVAAADIDIGARISTEQFRFVEWPSGSVPQGAFSESVLVDGRVAKTSLAKGEPIIEAKLAPVGSKGGLSAVVAEGKRAMTVRVNDVVGVAGFALPGNYVDIMVNTQDPDAARGRDVRRGDQQISKIVLERILVLAVAQEANRDATKPKVVNAVTLEVTPVEAEKLDLARSVGTLSLVLRNQVDPKPGDTDGATKESLFELAAPPAPVPAAPKAAPVRRPMAAAPAPQAPKPTKECVEVIRGTSKSLECF